MVSPFPLVPTELKGTSEDGEDDDTGQVQIELPRGQGVDGDQLRGGKLVWIVGQDEPKSPHQPESTDESGA